MRWTRTGTRIGLLSAACVTIMAGCASGPRGAYFTPLEAESRAVRLPGSPKPQVGVVGILVEDRETGSTRHRAVHVKRDALGPLLVPLMHGLESNVQLRFAAVDSPWLQVNCALPAPDAVVVPEDAPCRMPDRLAAPADRRSGGLGESTHLLIVIGWTALTAGPTRTVWGIGPGAPVFTTETDVSVYTKVAARLFRLDTGELLTEAIAMDGGGGGRGIMLGAIPFDAVPDRFRLLEAVAQAVGMEIARRLRVIERTERLGLSKPLSSNLQARGVARAMIATQSAPRGSAP